MNALVIYDSQFGNTQKIAKEIAQELKGKAIKASDVKKEMLKDASLLIVGSPILGWKPMVSISSLISSLPADSLKNINIASFDTRMKVFFSGDAAAKISSQMVTLGGNCVSPPGKFYVKGKEGPLLEGELEKARVWAKQISLNIKK